MKNRKLKATLYIISIGLIIHFVLNGLFFNVNQKVYYQNQNLKKWSHRGVGFAGKENTIESIKQAIKNGYAGVEIDVRYENEKLYVIHDGEVKEKTLLLDSVFRIFPNVKFWVDLKNLTVFNVNGIEAKIKKYNRNNFIVESKNSIALALLNYKKYNTSLWLTPNKQPFYQLYFSIKGWKELFKLNLIVLVNYNAISMPVLMYNNKNVQERYKHLNIHLWTSKSSGSKLYKEIERRSEVKIILDDDELY